MRRMIRAAAVAATGFVMALGIASATDRFEQSPEGRAYVGFAFGGERAVPRTFHYGLRLDHDARFVEGPVAPLMQFDFTKRGLYDARLNGLSVLKTEYRLRQAEEAPPEETGAEAPPAEEAPAEEAAAEAAPAEETAEAEAPAEEGGFFSAVGNFFGGLFGDDDEEELAEAPAEAAPAETDTAEAEEAPAEATEGGFGSYSVVDWGLLALGAVGVGMAVSETIGGDESPDAPATSTTGGTTTGGTPLGGLTPTGGTTPLGLTPVGLTGYLPMTNMSAETRERLEWLDGGTGQMGDLDPQP